MAVNTYSQAVISWGSKKQVSVALSSCEADKRSWRHCRRHIRGGQGSSLPLTLPGRARSRLHRAHRSRWAWTIKPPSPSSSPARLHNHRHRPLLVRSVSSSSAPCRLCMYDLIGFVSFDINAPEGCRHGTHTNGTAYIRGTYSRVHTHLLIKSLTLGKTTFASNLARRRRKNHGFEPHIGKKCFPARFLPFCLPRFVLCFPPSVLPAALSLPAAPFTFSGSHCPLLTYISSCDTSCTPDLGFPIFFVRPPEFCLSPIWGTPASASGAKV